ncbi:unnamed protein product [Mytilus coruscus]|uniref:Uncharacterized protein n=1 Tax=Mytilus coruscus TaxID=42192 RepID=A0A6J8CFN6_MYTCO|nr:unnamed protein product [Mytilus coruscus]
MADYYLDSWEDYNNQNMLVVFIGLVMIIVLLVYLWRCCKCDEDTPGTTITPARQQIPLVPCYAHEIEPGLVVLQSPDGEYFRILQEYDATKLPKQPTASNGLPQPLHFVPQFTRAHYQTHAQPTAPVNEQSHLIDFGATANPPPYYTAGVHP